MKKKITLKEISENLHTYGKVSWVGGSGNQFVLPYQWRNVEKGYGFKFLFFGYGKKSEVIRKFAEVINTNTDEELAQLSFVQCNKKLPISLSGYTGLNCF